MDSNVDDLADFVSLRPRLFGIAYRMLGSSAEAEDLVQDVWVRWQASDRSAVQAPTAYLVTMTTRMALDRMQAARARREQYSGPWLPEPVDTSSDAFLGAETGDSLALAVLMLLERLSPAERAAFVLREAFGYTYESIAGILDLREANVRQLVSRARRHVVDGRRAPVGSTEQRRLLEAFLAAAQRGDLATLEGLLAAEVVSTSDGGGRIGVARIPVVGRVRVAKFVARFASRTWDQLTLHAVEANGRASALLLRGCAVHGLVTIEASEHGIDQVLWLMNPEKLAAFGARTSSSEP